MFFATGRSKRPSFRTACRLVQRRPRKTYYIFLSWLVRCLSGSRLCHVAVGSCDGVVLDPAMQGDRFWPLAAFCLHYPTLAEVIYLDRDVPIEDHKPGPRRHALPTVLRWITGGRYPTRDCVQVVLQRLRIAGLTPPERLTTPKELHDWLVQQGYQHETIE